MTSNARLLYILYSSFGWFPGAWSLCADVSEHSVSSIFIGGVFTPHKYGPRQRSRYRTTGYGLYGPGIESQWGWCFPHPSSPVLGPTQLPIQWAPVLFPEGKAAGTWRSPPTSSRTESKERVKLYFYSTSGPSWPVLWRTVTFTFLGSRCKYSSFVLISPVSTIHLHSAVHTIHPSTACLTQTPSKELLNGPKSTQCSF
jgi:hypothetical protein